MPHKSRIIQRTLREMPGQIKEIPQTCQDKYDVIEQIMAAGFSEQKFHNVFSKILYQDAYSLSVINSMFNFMMMYRKTWFRGPFGQKMNYFKAMNDFNEWMLSTDINPEKIFEELKLIDGKITTYTTFKSQCKNAQITSPYPKLNYSKHASLALRGPNITVTKAISNIIKMIQQKNEEFWKNDAF